MKLEIIERNPAEAVAGSPLLFVHGLAHGAWCWDYWMDWFAARGRPSRAVSLRGHAGSEGRESLDTFGLDDYLTDVLNVAPTMPERPVLVGHSMGGAVAQLAVAAQPSLFAGVVLLAPLPHDSMGFREILPLVFRWRAARSSSKLMRGERLTAAEAQNLTFFDRRLSPEEAERCAGLLQPESRKAQKDLIAFRAPPVKEGPPMLVLGSARDVLFGRHALTRTARHFGADLIVLDEGCHDLMVDPVWPDVAQVLDTWLKQKAL